ncbi:MAG: glycosyltransferase family 2 protein [Chloroflexi bacterium]|nr:glycosyltransferase family 2 protein [Chloroflexota bacterium]
MGFVSIIMKVWNAPAHVRLCMKTLLQNTDDPFELIVVDNGSKPEVVQFLRATARGDPRIRLVENPANLGPGHANRQGVALAKSRTICLIDSDVLVPHHWLVRLVEEFEKHPDVKLLAPLNYHQTLSHPFGPDNSAEAWFRTKKENQRLSPLRQFHVYSGGLSIDEFDELMCSTHAQELAVQTCPPMFTGTCCALLDADFVASVGGVADPRFTRYGSEDADLCWRIGEHGGQVARTTAVYVHHFHNSSLIDNAVDPDAALRTANQILYAKWKQKLIGLVLAEARRGGTLKDYLSAYFIFQPLSHETSFIADLRAATQRTDIPDRIVWKPRPGVDKVPSPCYHAPIG